MGLHGEIEEKLFYIYVLHFSIMPRKRGGKWR
jgi:hypothetical protein